MIEIDNGNAKIWLAPDTNLRAYSSRSTQQTYNLEDLLIAVERVVGAVHPDGSGEAVIRHLKEARQELNQPK